MFYSKVVKGISLKQNHKYGMFKFRSPRQPLSYSPLMKNSAEQPLGLTNFEQNLRENHIGMLIVGYVCDVLLYLIDDLKVVLH